MTPTADEPPHATAPHPSPDGQTPDTPMNHTPTNDRPTFDNPMVDTTLQPLARELSQLVHSAMAKTLRDAAAADNKSPRLRTPRAQQAVGASAHGPGVLALAALNPGDAAARREAQTLYARCLQHYRRHVQPQLEGGVHTQDDLGIAAAFFVLSNLGACQDLEPDVAALPAVERQLRSLLAQTTAWRQLGNVERQSLFEQFALLGVLINESRVGAQQQGPAAKANVQRAARGYLQQLLGLSPERLSASVQGLAVVDRLH